MNKIQSNDNVIVITGKDKGKTGTVSSVLGHKLLVSGINVSKKHQKPNPNAGVTGGIIDKEMPIDSSNVMLVNPATGKGDRVGIKLDDKGKKVRYFKSNGELV